MILKLTLDKPKGCAAWWEWDVYHTGLQLPTSESGMVYWHTPIGKLREFFHR